MTESKNEMAIQLNHAIETQQPYAFDLAASMGRQAIDELTKLCQHAKASVKMDALGILATLDLQNSYKIIFDALNDKNINVVNTSLGLIEENKASLSAQILFALLDKVKPLNAKNRVILMLGDVLAAQNLASQKSMSQSTDKQQHSKYMINLEKYCSVEYGESMALHSVAALAKAGAEQRRHQFGAYMMSVTNTPMLLNTVFTFVDYIQQLWLLPLLKQLLLNKQVLHSVAAQLPGIPASIRVCDRATMCIGSILKASALDSPPTISKSANSNQLLSFPTDKFANFTDEQLAEAARIVMNFRA